MLYGRIEKRNHTLLAPRKLSCIMRRKRRAPVAPCALEREPRAN